MRYITWVLLLLCMAAHADEPPQLLVLAAYHMSNPGHDTTNVHADDVTTARRQQEVQAVVDALARFRPTHIAVERPPAYQARMDAHYQAYLAGHASLAPSEDEQIGMRLAKQLGLAHLDAVDFNDAPPVPPASIDMTEGAARLGLEDVRNGIRQRDQARVDQLQQVLARGTVADTLRYINNPVQSDAFGREYFNYLRVGRGNDTPGATWLQFWYGRNLRIFRNLETLAKPGDRVLVIYGFGHAYLLKQFARESGAFEVVDAGRYLPR